MVMVMTMNLRQHVARRVYQQSNGIWTHWRFPMLSAYLISVSAIVVKCKTFTIHHYIRKNYT